MIFSSVPYIGTPPCSRSFHASAVVGDGIYIHGGLDAEHKVLSTLHQFDTKLKTWSVVDANPSQPRKSSSKMPALESCNAPGLSHHCAVTYEHRFIILIGGWNGKKRTSEVFLFDTDDLMWNKITVFGDIPVGLSSHTATLVSRNEITIIGREGGVHTHRRSGDVFTLNPITGEYRQAMYGIDSRSGHTSNLIRSSCKKGYSIFVYSGRKTGQQYSLVGFWNHKHGKDNVVSSDFAAKLKEFMCMSTKVDIPVGRQNCRAICVDDQIVVIYGGQLWQARDFISSELFAYNCTNCSWHRLPKAAPIPKLTGFSLDIGSDGHCYVFGGNDGKNSNNTLWHLGFST